MFFPLTTSPLLLLPANLVKHLIYRKDPASKFYCSRTLCF